MSTQAGATHAGEEADMAGADPGEDLPVRLLGQGEGRPIMDVIVNPETGAFASPRLNEDELKVFERMRGLKPRIDRSARVAHSLVFVDSGVLSAHPQIGSRLVMEKDFTGEGTEDTIGHGTAVALIGLALADAAGTEPDLISVKVVGRRGRGRRSDYLDALHWLASLPAQRPGEKLTVGMSLGLLPPASGCRGTCDVCEAAVTLSRSDVVVTVAAGNFGLERTTCPGNAARYRDDHAILSVGAADYDESGFGSVMAVGERRFDIDKPTAAYLEGMACAERDEASRAEALLQEAATFGHRPAMINLGVLLYRRGEYEQAETWLRKATAQNDPAGLYALGLALLAKGSLEDAQHWLLASAEAGADAAEALDRVERRLADARAEKTYRRKAEHGDARAAYELAVVLSRQDAQEEAEFWYRHAAALGDPDAMNDLGVRLARRGEIGEAIKTWLPAAKNGHGPAGENLRRAVEMLRAGG